MKLPQRGSADTRLRALPSLASDPRRRRLIEAVAEVVAEVGHSRMTVARIVAEAHVSRRTFYEHFESPAEALAVAHRSVADWLLAAIQRECHAAKEWPERLHRALDLVFGFAATEPRLARMLAVDFHVVEPAAARQVGDTLSRFADLLRSERPPSAVRHELVELDLELFAVNGIAWLVSREIAAGRERQLPGLVDEIARLVELIVGTQGVQSPGRTSQTEDQNDCR